MQSGLKPHKRSVLIFPYFNFGCVCLDYTFSLTLVHVQPKQTDQKYIAMQNTPGTQRFIPLPFTLASRSSGVMFSKWEKVFDFLSTLGTDRV